MLHMDLPLLNVSMLQRFVFLKVSCSRWKVFLFALPYCKSIYLSNTSTKAGSKNSPYPTIILLFYFLFAGHRFSSKCVCCSSGVLGWPFCTTSYWNQSPVVSLATVLSKIRIGWWPLCQPCLHWAVSGIMRNWNSIQYYRTTCQRAVEVSVTESMSFLVYS